MARFRQPNRELTVRQLRRIEELLPADHLARFVWASLMSLDFGPVEALYPSIQGGPGTSPFHPRALMALWTYGMCQGLSTAASIAKACTLRDDFRWLAGGLRPCDQTLLNFVARAAGNEALQWIWSQVLWVLQDAGQIDLGVLLEDGTKVRANASRRSFHPAAEIASVIEQLKSLLAAKLDGLAQRPDASAANPRQRREVRALRDKLARAELAASELERRCNAQKARQLDASPRKDNLAAAGFKLDAERDLLVCPAGESLTFRGAYPTTNRKGVYRLYQRSNCGGCPLKASCTDAVGRRVKLIQSPAPAAAQSQAASSSPEPSAPATTEQETATGPQASLTDPQAVLMLATSVKAFAPSYNADITTTRQGFIVNQFLTQNPTDYHSFERALPAVLDVLGHPDCWIGDGHYGTQANLLLAHQHHVPLYAPPPSGDATRMPSAAPQATPLRRQPATRFGRSAFTQQSEPDVLICPGEHELRLVNVYPASHGRRAHKLYQRSNCSDCSLRAQCTSDLGRRVKVPVVPEATPTPEPSETPAPDPLPIDLLEQLVRAQSARLSEHGERTRKLRGQTAEPVNAQLKLHGLDRLHTRGLMKGSVILLLACTAHNLLKWHTREAARVELAAA